MVFVDRDTHLSIYVCASLLLPPLNCEYVRCVIHCINEFKIDTPACSRNVC
jgi:hypothetical protein